MMMAGFDITREKTKRENLHTIKESYTNTTTHHKNTHITRTHENNKNSRKDITH